VGHVALKEDRRGALRILVGKPEGKRPLGRPKHQQKIVLKWILKKWNGGGHGLDRFGSG